MINKLLAQSIVRPQPVRPSGMVMSAASRIPSIGLLRRSKPIFNPPATISSTTSLVSVREPIHTTPPPTSQPAARSRSPASMPPQTGGYFVFILGDKRLLRLVKNQSCLKESNFDDNDGPITFKRYTSSKKYQLHSKVRKPVSYEDDDDLPLTARAQQVVQACDKQELPISCEEDDDLPLSARVQQVVKACDKPELLNHSNFEDNSKRYTSSKKNQLHSEMRKSISYENDDDLPLSGRIQQAVEYTTFKKNQCLSKVRKSASCEDSNDDNTNLPLSAMLRQEYEKNNLGTDSSNCDDSVKKRSSTYKRVLDNNNSLQIAVQKSKASSYDDDGNNPISQRIKRSDISADESFSMMKFKEKELAMIEKSIEECQWKRQVEEQRLQSLERDIEECSKELENKKKEISCIQSLNEVPKKMQMKIEECVEDLVAKGAQLSLMEDLIKEHEQELKTKEIERHQVMNNIDKDRERKEEELKALFQKISACTKELKTKEEELDAMKKLIDGQAKDLESKRKMLPKVMSERRTDQCAQIKDFESMKKQFERQDKELESKEKPCEGRVNELESRE
ncbi:frigida-LIKE protein [Sesbania bispinosa]|nr:frigida-LIKE protein [Sesbania bispinosa]